MAGFFENIINKLSGKDSVLGADIGSSAIKLVQLKSEKGAVVLESYGSIAVGPYSNSDIGKSFNLSSNDLVKVITDISKEADLNSKKVGFSIPFKSSLVSLITLPDLPEDKLVQTIPYEARKYIPVPMDEVSIDWMLIPDAVFDNSANESGKVVKRALLIAIHNFDLQKYREVVNKLQYDLLFFEIEIFSSIRSILGKNRVPTVVVDIGARTTKFYIIEHDIVLKSYFINQGGQNVTQAIANVLNLSFKESEVLKRDNGLELEHDSARKAVMVIFDNIFNEINRIISDFQNVHKKDVSRLIFTGGGSLTKGLLKYSENKLHVIPELADPFNKTQTPKFLNETLKEVGPEFAVAVGAALRALESK